MPKRPADYEDEAPTSVETPLPPIRHDAEALTYRFDEEPREREGAQRT
jgi:hypothetical protein